MLLRNCESREVGSKAVVVFDNPYLMPFHPEG